MNEEIAKPISLTRRTSTPAASAARSVGRHASIRWPRLLRRRLATPMPRITATTTHSRPNTGLGGVAALIGNEAVGPRFRPSRWGALTGAPDAPPPITG